MQIVYLCANLDDLTGRLIAHDVRPIGQSSTPAVEDVTALDADRLDPNDDAFRMALRIGYVLVAEHARLAVFVVDRCFHGRPCQESGGDGGIRTLGTALHRTTV